MSLTDYAHLTILAVASGAKWNSDWYPPIAACYVGGQVVMVGSKTSTDAPSQARIIRWTEIGQFDFLGQTASAGRNEAGFAYAPVDDKEILLNVLPLGKMAIVYGSLCVLTMQPVAKPVPSFAIKQVQEVPVGIPCTTAVGVGSGKHLMVCRDGNLRLVKAVTGMFGGDTYEVKKLGYSEFFREMVDECDAISGVNLISVVYNPDEDCFYIGNGRRQFMWAEEGLTEMGTAVASIMSIANSPYADPLVKASIGTMPVGFYKTGSEGFLYETDILDFGLAGIKTIESVAVVGHLDEASEPEIMVKWRNDRRGEFRDTNWVRLSPEGFCAPIVSGVELRICLRASACYNMEFDGLIVTWKISDKRFIRGVQNADRAEA